MPLNLSRPGTFRACRSGAKSSVATDGQHAIDYLSGHKKFADRDKHPMPCLILLDLKLPLKMGLEVLEWVRGQPPPMKNTIVIVLSSSVHEGDIARAYGLGANAF